MPQLRNIGQEPGTDGNSYQSQGWIADFGGHAPDLTVLALGDGNFQPSRRNTLPEAYRWLPRPECGRRWNELRQRGVGNEITEIQGSSQRSQVQIGWLALHLYPRAVPGAET